MMRNFQLFNVVGFKKWTFGHARKSSKGCWVCFSQIDNLNYELVFLFDYNEK